MSNSSEHMTFSGIKCATCGEPIAEGTRAVVFSELVAYCRRDWLAIVQPPKPTALERRAGRNWPRVGRCRISA